MYADWPGFVDMLLWQISVAVMLVIAPSCIGAALPFLRPRHDSPAATSKLHSTSGGTIGGTQSRLHGVAKALHARSLIDRSVFARRSAKARSTVPTTSELLEWASKLRGEESNLATEILGVQAAMSNVEALVSNLTLNVSRVSNALSVTLQDVRTSSASRKKLEADAAVIEQPNINDFNATANQLANITAMVGPDQLAELRNLSKWFPGGEVSQQIDVADSNFHVYEQDVQAAVERTLTANSSWELQSFMDSQRLALSNLSNITSGGGTGDCKCPPCSTTGA